MVKGVRFGVVLVLVATMLPAGSEAGGRTADAQKAGIHLVAAKPSSRFCKPGDVVGIWRLVKWTSDFQFKDPKAPFLLPYQLFQFSADKVMKSAHSAKPFQGDPVKMFKAMPALVTYAFDRDGMLTIKANGSAASETWHCVWMTENRADEQRQTLLKKGDLVMTLVGNNGQALYARQMSR
ncbi:MAG: hypothetical protein ACREIS_05260 [Nitrospiraceae bacterium]